MVSSYDAGKFCIWKPELDGGALPYYYEAAGVCTACKWSIVSCHFNEAADVALCSIEPYSRPYGHGLGERIDLVACCHACDVGDSSACSYKPMCVDRMMCNWC